MRDTTANEQQTAAKEDRKAQRAAKREDMKRRYREDQAKRKQKFADTKAKAAANRQKHERRLLELKGVEVVHNTADVQTFAGVELADGTISYQGETYPAAGVRAMVETAGELHRRTTASRTVGGAVLFGPVGAVVGALASKKVDERQLFLMIEGPEFAWSVEVPSPKKHAGEAQTEARAFAASVTSAGKQNVSG